MWYILTSIFILFYQLSIASLLRDNRVESPVISLSSDITSSSPAGSTDRVTVSRLDFLSAASTSTHDRLRAMTMDNVHGWASLWVDLWTCPTYAPHDSPPTGSRDAPNPGHTYAHAYGSGLTLSLWPLHAHKCNGHHSISTPSMHTLNLKTAARWGRTHNGTQTRNRHGL